MKLLCLAMMMIAGAPVWATPSSTTIQDTVVLANGARFSGTVEITWSSFTASDRSLVPAGQLKLNVVNGVLNVQLVPTISASPAGTTYVVRYQSDNNFVAVERWNVPPSAAPVRLSAVRLGTSSGGSSSGPPALGTINISDVTGLPTELANRPIKGSAYQVNRVVVTGTSGDLDTVTGDPADCVRVDGSTGPCGTGTGGGGSGTVTGVSSSDQSISVTGATGPVVDVRVNDSRFVRYTSGSVAPTGSCSVNQLYWQTGPAPALWFCSLPGIWTQAGVSGGSGGTGGISAVLGGDGVVCSTAGGQVNCSVDVATIPHYAQGSGAPAIACGTGDFYIQTNVTPQKFYFCGNTNTWAESGGLPAGGTANQLVGRDASGSNAEYKSLVAGAGIAITNAAGQVTIAAAGGGSTPVTSTSVFDYDEFAYVGQVLQNSGGEGALTNNGRWMVLRNTEVKGTQGNEYASYVTAAYGTAIIRAFSTPANSIFGLWYGSPVRADTAMPMGHHLNKTVEFRLYHTGTTSATPIILGYWGKSVSQVDWPGTATWGASTGTSFYPANVMGALVVMDVANGIVLQTSDGTTSRRDVISPTLQANVAYTVSISVTGSTWANSAITVTATPDGGAAATYTLASGTGPRPPAAASYLALIAGGIGSGAQIYMDYFKVTGTR